MTSPKKTKRSRRGPGDDVPTRRVALDAFGNAIPEVPSATVEGTGKALRVVEHRDIVVAPSPRQRRAQSQILAPAIDQAARNSWVNRLRGVFARRSAVQDPQIQRQAHEEFVADLSHRFEHAFHELKREFDEREEQLESRLVELKQHHQQLLSAKQKKKLWVFAPLAVLGMLAGGYLLSVLTSMEGSMTAMSGNISSMNGSMLSMSNDTVSMAQGLQNLNGSVAYMNHSVASLNNNVAYMNQNIGQISQSVQPMGEAAESVNPVMRMFKSFMPF